MLSLVFSFSSMRNRFQFLAIYCLSFLFTGLAFSQGRPVLSLEGIMQDPKWIGSQPSAPFWSPDGKSILFNWNPYRSERDSLYEFNLRNSSVRCFREDVELQMATRSGVWNKDRTKLVFACRGDLFLMVLSTGKLIRITNTQEEESRPSFCFSEQRILFQKANDLFTWSIKDGSVQQICHFKGPGEKSSSIIPLSIQDSILQNQELALFPVLQSRREKKLLLENRYRNPDSVRVFETKGKRVQDAGLSPDGRFLSYQLVEKANKSTLTQIPFFVNETGNTEVRPSRENVGHLQDKYSFFLYDFRKDTIVEFNPGFLSGIKDVPDYFKEYPADRFHPRGKLRAIELQQLTWNQSSGNAVLVFDAQDHKDRWFVGFNSASQRFNELDRQHDEAWIGGPAAASSVQWISDQSVVFLTEKSGFSHISSLDLPTGKKQDLTQGNFEIRNLVASHDKKSLFFLANQDHPGAVSWCRMNLTEPGKIEKITSLKGGYEVQMSPDQKWIAFRYSTSNCPWELFVQENRTGMKPVQITRKAMSPEFAAYPWREPSVIQFPASDGAAVYARLYAPEKKNGAAVIFVHGAGYLQNAHFWWSNYFREYMFHNMLTDMGYTVIDVDYRGSAGYGRNWRSGIYRHMGGRDLEDQVDAAKYLVQNYGVDPARIGIYGGSYGGFITLMALFQKPGMFKAGAALRSVTDWSHYNHGYTSEILNEPQTDSLAFRRSSPIFFAEGLKDRLLMCHGMVDGNVHFQDIVRLSQRLIELKKENWELAVYPVEDHGFVEPSSWLDEYRRILKLFNEELLRR